MNRKEFLKTCSLACIGSTAVVGLLQSCGSISYYAQSHITGHKIIIPRSEFIKTKDGKSSDRSFVLVKHDRFTYPICVYRLPKDQYSALLMQCTHNGCELQPNGQMLVCPCHGSEFSNTGIVQNPPAEQNLQSFITQTDQENIYVFIKA